MNKQVMKDLLRRRSAEGDVVISGGKGGVSTAKLGTTFDVSDRMSLRIFNC